MARTVHYPKDVAAAFFRYQDESRRWADALIERMLGGSAGQHDAQRVAQVPSELVLEQLVETMLFASIAPEEGRTQPVGIVWAARLDEFGSQEFPWDLTTFREHKRFGVEDVAKLAAVGEFPRGLLVVTLEDGELKIVGVATPHSRILAREGMVRVLAPRPGTVVVTRGTKEVVRYDKGSIRPLPPDFVDHNQGRRPEQWTSITKAVTESTLPAGFTLPDAELYLIDELLRVVSKMSYLGRGGILAVRGPSNEATALPDGAIELAPPMEYGRAIWAHLKAKHERLRRLPLGLRDEMDTTSQPLERARQQLVRLTAVDGAVLMSHSLRILSFGTKFKLATTPVNVVDGHQGGRWPLGARGARHKAAATFALEHPDGLSFIVSQDGEAAIFRALDDQTVGHWPLGIPVGDLTGN